MGYVKEGLRRGLIGFLMGIFLSYTMLLVSSLGHDIVTLDVKMLIQQYTMYGICGFYFAMISIYFSIEEWSFLRVILTHVVSTLPFLPLAYIIGMMPHSSFGIVSFVSIYLLCYICSFIAYLIYVKKQAKLINASL